MAKKRPRPRKRVTRRSGQTPPASDFPSGLPDRRAMEGIMKGFVDSVSGGPKADTPLARAEEIMYQAFNTTKPAERVRLARKALDVSADCADAYVVLARARPERHGSPRIL